MKKLFMVSFLFIITSCDSEKSLTITGYYFSKNNANIYHFNDKKVIEYNFIDSTSISMPIKNDIKSITFGGNSYKYNFYDNDSIVIYDFKEVGENLNLEKFKHKDFNINQLNGTEWLYLDDNKKKYDPQGFIKIKSNVGIYNFFKHDDEIHARMSFFNKFEGKFFNKFYFYSGPTPFVLTNHNKKNLFSLHLLEDNKFEKSMFANVPTKEISPLIIGNWVKIRDTILKNKMIHHRYGRYAKMKSNDSLKDVIDYSNIEFTKKGYLIRKIKRKNKILDTKYKIDYSSIANFIFINNPDFVSQYFEIKKLTKDSLIIQISNPELLYTYIKTR